MYMVSDTDTVAIYVRSSTEQQVAGHQWQSIQDWIDEHDIDREQVTEYADVGSGSSTDERDEFLELLTAVEDGDIDHVVTWEISRLSRDGEILQRFFNACEDNNIDVWVTDGTVDVVKSDGTNRLLADIVAAVYQQERRSLIRRVEAGIERARSDGKWIGRTPAGFERDPNGRLQPILDPGDSEDSYLEIRRALRLCEAGESYRSVADELSMTRQGLAKLHQHDDRREWYLDAEADDTRVTEALRDVSTDTGSEEVR